MQHAAFPNRNSAGRTGDRGNLFGSEFAFLHAHRVRQDCTARMLNLAHVWNWQTRAKMRGFFSCHGTIILVVQDDAEERFIDVEFAIVLDEAQLPKFVHEKIHSGPGCPDHVR